MDDRDARVVLDAPARVPRPTGRGRLPHSRGRNPRPSRPAASSSWALTQHARPRDPRDGAGPGPPIGLVFPPGARYQLLPERSGAGWGRTRRRAARPVGVAEAEADDARRGRPSASNRRTRRDDRRPSQPVRGDDVGVEHAGASGPAAARQPALTPTANPPFSARAISVDARAGTLELGGDRSGRGIVDHDDLAASPAATSGVAPATPTSRATSGQEL